MHSPYNSKRGKSDPSLFQTLRDLYKALAKPILHSSQTSSVKRDTRRTPEFPVSRTLRLPPSVLVCRVSDPDLDTNLI